MVFDTTIQLGDIIMTVLSLVLIPGLWQLARTLRETREALQEMRYILLGTDRDPTTGVVHDVAALKKESQRHRNWLIEIRAEQGMKLDDRS